MTRGEIVLEVALSIGLDKTVGTDELKLMQRWTNQGVMDVLLNTQCYLDEGQMALAAGATDFRLDQKILAVSDVHITNGSTSGGYAQLEFMNWRDVDELLASGPTSDLPAYASVKGDFMRITPAPSGGCTVMWFYVPKPDPMLADGTLTDDDKDPSTPSYGGIPTQYHDAIVAYVLWKAAEYDDKGGGFARGTAFAPGSAYQQNYMQRVKEIRKQNRKKSGPSIPAARIGYPDRGRIARRNDQY